MKIRAAVFCLAAAACAVAQQVPKKIYRVETSDPKDIRMEVVHGETINLQWTFLSYANPLDIESAAVTLHARTNGMAEGVSFQVPGAAGPGGVATVRLAVSEWLPASVSEAEWTLEVVQPDAARILRAKGTVTATRSAAASTNDPVPVVWLDDIRAEIGAVQALGPRLDSIETEAADWRAAFAWGPHFAAGYLLPADLAPYATTQQVAAATGGKLDAAATNSALRAEWFPDAYGTGEGHLRIADANTDDAVYLGPLGVGQWRRADWENPSGVDRFVSWHDIPERGEIEEASNNLAHVIGALNAADVGALPSAGESAGLAVEWKANVYPETEEGHLRIFDPLNQNEILLGPHGFGQFRTPDAEHPAGLDRYVPWASLPTLDDIAAVPTNYVPLADKELHRDSHTNLIWKSVYSNGWHFLIAYTNTPSGGGE